MFVRGVPANRGMCLIAVLVFVNTGWGLRKNYAQEDLNLRPSDPQSDTLSS